MSKIRLHGSSSGYTEIAPVAASGNNTLTLPNDGTIISKDSAGAIGVTSVHTTNITATGIATITTAKVGAAVTISESGVAAAGLAITCKSLNGQQFSHRNVWINGEFSVAQRGTQQTSITSLSGYATGGPDRCFIVISGHGTYTVKQGTDAPSGFQNCMELISTTGDSSVGSSASVRWWQRFEGQNLQRFAKGTSDAKEFTLSFYIKAKQTGTYAFELLDYDSANRHVVKTYTVDVAETWEYKTITFPADTTGAFDNDANNSLAAEFWLVAGSDYTSGGTQTTWADMSNNKRAGGHTVNAFAANNDYVRITGVQLEVGNQATEYEHKTHAEELAACQRYYYKHPIVDGYGPYFTQYHANHKFVHDFFPVSMRAEPSATVTYTGNSETPTAFKITKNHFKAYVGSAAYDSTTSIYMASAEYSAEL